MPDTSLTLLDQLRDKDPKHGWERLVALYGPLIRGWLSRNGFQPADVDDLCQEVLQRLNQSLAAFRHAGTGSFRSWLRAITVNATRDFRRRHLRAVPLAPPHAIPTLDAVADDHDELMRRWDEEYNTAVIQSALQSVKPHFDPVSWQAFCRVTFEGQSPQSVASELSISTNSVYLARSRILRRLRAEVRGLLD